MTPDHKSHDLIRGLFVNDLHYHVTQLLRGCPVALIHAAVASVQAFQWTDRGKRNLKRVLVKEKFGLGKKYGQQSFKIWKP